MEFGSPRDLLRRRGVFWDMVGKSGERGGLEDVIFGGGGDGDGDGI